MLPDGSGLEAQGSRLRDSGKNMGILEDYQQIIENAAIGEVAATHQLAVAGNDRAPFLQGLLTNDIQALKPGEGCYAAWLTPQGRMLTDLHVLESDGMMLLDVPAAQADATLARLEQFLFSEDVKLGSLAGALTTVWVHGPGAASALEQSLDGVAGLGAWAQYHHEHVGFAGESAVKPKAQPGPMQVAAYDQFRFGVLSPDSGHHSASGRAINDVHANQAANSDFCFAKSGSMSSRMRGFMMRATSRMTGITTLLPNCL